VQDRPAPIPLFVDLYRLSRTKMNVQVGQLVWEASKATATVITSRGKRRLFIETSQVASFHNCAVSKQRKILPYFGLRTCCTVLVALVIFCKFRHNLQSRGCATSAEQYRPPYHEYCTRERTQTQLLQCPYLEPREG